MAKQTAKTSPTTDDTTKVEGVVSTPEVSKATNDDRGTATKEQIKTPATPNNWKELGYLNHDGVKYFGAKVRKGTIVRNNNGGLTFIPNAEIVDRGNGVEPV